MRKNITWFSGENKLTFYGNLKKDKNALLSA